MIKSWSNLWFYFSRHAPHTYRRSILKHFMFQSIFNRPGGCEWQRCSAIVEMAEGTGERPLGLRDQVEFHQVCRRPGRESRRPDWTHVRPNPSRPNWSWETYREAGGSVNLNLGLQHLPGRQNDRIWKITLLWIWLLMTWGRSGKWVQGPEWPRSESGVKFIQTPK